MSEAWLKYESDRLSKKLGQPVSIDEVKKIMAERGKLQKPEHKAFSDPSKAREAARTRWAKHYAKKAQDEKDG